MSEFAGASRELYLLFGGLGALLLIASGIGALLARRASTPAGVETVRNLVERINAILGQGSAQQRMQA